MEGLRESSIRIQLEGQLELVETAERAWRAAAEALESDAWQDDPRWLAVAERSPLLEEAISALEARLEGSPDAPEAATLVSLRDAQHRAEASAIVRLREQRSEVPPAMVGAVGTLKKLKNERPLEWHGLTPLRLSVLNTLLLLGLLIWASVSVSQAEIPPFEKLLLALFNLVGVAATSLAGWALARFFRPVYRLQLTDTSVRVLRGDAELCAFERDRLIQIRVRQRARGWVLQLFERDRPIPLELEADEPLGRVLSALRERGFSVEDLQKTTN